MHDDDAGRAIPPGFGITTTSDGLGRTTIQLTGELDLATAPQLTRELTTLLGADGVRHVTIDASDLTFVDSSGLSVLLTLSDETRRHGGTFTLSDPRPAVHKIIRTAGVHEHLGM